MAADTALKRYSAMNVGSPWRGLNVYPDVTIPQGERQAVMFLYGSPLTVTPPAPSVTTTTFAGFGGGFLGPHYKRRRKCLEEEGVCVAPPITTTRFIPSLNRVLIETIKLPSYRPQPDRIPAPSLYRSKMTRSLRSLLEEMDAQARAEAERQKRLKRLKRLKDDDELILMLL